MLVSLVLWQLIERCAPRVAPLTMSALISTESAFDPYAIDDDTAGRAYAPEDRASAEALATRLLAEGHSIDVGYAQVNSGNFAALGLDVHRAFEPCDNVAAGGRILLSAYAAAVRRYGTSPPPLEHALSAYNTGHQTRGLAYARRVFAAGRRLRGAPQ